jgi:uncharacterized protein YbcV (DUF1398 family)
VSARAQSVGALSVKVEAVTDHDVSLPTGVRRWSDWSMFTVQQVDEIHERLGSASTLRAYLEALREIGVVASDSYLTDGHTVHRGVDGYEVSTAPAHEVFEIAATSDKQALVEQLRQHETGATSYVEMSRGLAAAGVEKWTFDTASLTITYYDRAGTALLSEAV